MDPAALGLTIPQGHARLLFSTPELLSRARAWYAAHPFTPASGAEFDNAFRYQMTGEASYARNAINSLMNFTISSTELAGVASDNYRWADWVPVVFDWCYDQMTASERSTFIARYNGYVQTLSQKSWGGPGMESSNYYWGYLRNEMNWAIATWYESPSTAQTFLAHALTTRWQNGFVPWAAGPGRGGVPQEGTQYGTYMLEYPLIPFSSATALGRDLFAETNFYKEALFYALYATSPGPLANEAGTSSYAQLFPFNEDEKSYGYPYASDLADFVAVMAEQFNGTDLEGYARQWLANTGSTPAAFVRAVDDGGTPKPLASLPTDYYAPGIGYFYVKDAWDPSATALDLQMGAPSAVGHVHPGEFGSFQISRNGRWLTKESTGYADWLAGGDSVNDAPAHNALTIAGQSPSNNAGDPVVTRLESRDDYAYASVRLTPAYPGAQAVVRDFLYVRALDTLLVFDRLQTSSTTAAKTFLLHFPKAPTVNPDGTVLGVNGSQALKLTTLTPAGQSAPSLRVVNETPSSPVNSTDYQYRLEVSTAGQALSYLVNVLQARDASGAGAADLTASMTEDANSFTITLSHPTLGTATITLNKGNASAGGSFSFTPAGAPTPTPAALTGSVEGITVTDAGPVWAGSGPVTPPPPTISFAQGTVTVGEGAGTATVTVTRGGDTTVPVTVSYATSNGTATAGSDYTAAGGTLSFAAGETSKTFAVTVLDDTAVEGNETVTLTLSAPSGGATLGQAVATLTISDNDVAPPPPDTTAPVISGVASSSVTTAAATVSWATNEPADTQVEYGTTTSYGSVTTRNATLATSHSQTLSGLGAGTLYHYRVLSRDAAGNLATSGDFTFTTVAVDTTPPVISAVSAGAVSTGGATITWATNELSDTQVEFGTTTAYGTLTPLNTARVTSHSAALAGLMAGTTYHYRVKSRDTAGNLATSGDFTFTTVAADTTPPVISGVGTSAVTTSGTTVNWMTDEASDTQVEYGTTAAYGSLTPLNTARVTSHAAALAGLAAGTTYHYRVLSRDAAGNLAASQDLTFTTASPPPPDPNPMVFGPAPVYGDFASYTPLTPSRWSVTPDATGDKRLVLGTDFPERAEDLVGEYALVTGRTYGDFDLTLQAQSSENLSTNASADYVVVFGYQDADNYSYLMLNGKAANTRFFHIAGGVATAYPASTARGIFDNNWHAVRLTRSGQTLTAFLDGQQILTTTDAGLAAPGALGIGSYNDKASFDNVSVAVPAPSTPAPSLATTTATDAPDSQRLFTTTYSDDNGADDLNYVYLRLNAYLPVMLDAIYCVPTNQLYLRGADGMALVGGFAPGSANVITAANGTLDCSKVTVSKSGNSLTVNWSLAAARWLAGDNQLFVRAIDRGGRDSGYQQPVGAHWMITGNQAPTNGPVVPPSGPTAAGAYTTFTSSYTDADGATNLKFVYLVLNADDPARRLELIYVAEQNRLFVRGDNGLSLLGGATPGTAAVISNSRGSLDCAGTTVTRTADTITVNWRVAASSALVGDNTVWTRAYDHGGRDTLYRKETGVIWTVLSPPA